MKKQTFNDIKKYIENEGYKIINNENDYKDSKSILTLSCPNNHLWNVSFGNFKHGLRCSECKKEHKKKIQYLIVKKYIEDNKYILLKDEYINNSIPMKMMCDKKHVSYISWNNFKRGRRCSVCYKFRKLTYQEVYDYFYKYGYELLSKEYKSAHEKLDVKCPKGHKFKISYAKFYIGRRCNICTSSSGEQSIMQILEKLNIKFEREKFFKECKDIKPLPFDFYLPDYNTCIEYDGEQHFKASSFNHTKTNLKYIQEHDNIKTSYCKDNNIKLIRIPYWEFNNIENIIKNKIIEINKPSTTIP